MLAVQAEDLSQIPLPMRLCYLSGAVIKIQWPGKLIQDGLGSSGSIRGHPGGGGMAVCGM